MTVASENLEYFNSLKFETFDIKKELNDKRNFTMTITSKRRTGKSILLKNLCLQIKDWYANVYVFSMSAHLQPDLFNFIPKENLINGFNEEKLLAIWQAQENLVMKMLKIGVLKKDIPKVLIIMDDIIGDDKVRHSQTLNNFFILGRHVEFAVILISQVIGGKWGLPGVIRSQVDVAIAFFLDAEYDRDLFCEQYLSTKNKKVGHMIYDFITRSIPYQAIVTLPCVTDPDPTKCIKTFVAKEKVPKFTMIKQRKPEHNAMFISSILPSSEGAGVNFMPRIGKNYYF